MAIREIGLGRSNDQDVQTGVYASPVANSTSADNPRDTVVTFNQLTVDGDTTPQGTAGLQLPLAGYALQVSPNSDPSTCIWVALGDSVNYVRMTPGMRIQTPSWFDRVFVKKTTNLPNTGAKLYLTVFQTPQAQVQAGPASSNQAQGGAPNGAVTKTSGFTVVTNVCAFRQGRRYVLLQNTGTNDVYIGFTNAVLQATGFLLPPGASVPLKLDTTSDVWAFPLGGVASTVEAIEQYNDV